MHKNESNSIFMERDASIPLIPSTERSSSIYRLSVIEEQTSKFRQEFSVQVTVTIIHFNLFFIGNLDW